jgi:nicotinate phosphoribosyltransferase
MLNFDVFSILSTVQVGTRVLCRHPFEESKRAYVMPHKVEKLYRLVWDEGKICVDMPNLGMIRDNVQASLRTLRQDHKRSLNPTPYKVRTSIDLYMYICIISKLKKN